MRFFVRLFQVFDPFLLIRHKQMSPFCAHKLCDHPDISPLPAGIRQVPYPLSKACSSHTEVMFLYNMPDFPASILVSPFLCLLSYHAWHISVPDTKNGQSIRQRRSFAYTAGAHSHAVGRSSAKRGITPRISGFPPWGSRRCGGAWRGGPARRRHRSEGRRRGRTEVRRGGRNTPCPP